MKLNKWNILRIIVSVVVVMVWTTTTTTLDTEPDAGGEARILGQQEVIDATPNDASAQHLVERVVDGDTIKVRIDEELQTVRVANINTPEIVDPRKPIECMGKEASEKMKELVENKQVALETDQTQSEKDRYGRLIRFVFLPDGTDVGLKLTSLGYAYATPYGSEPHQYFEIYETAQREAEQNNLGLWSPDLCVE